MGSLFLGSQPSTTATTATAAAAGTACRQLLPRLLEHQLGIQARADHPHNDVVTTGGLVKQQGRVQAHPAEHQLLIGIHGDGNDLLVEATRSRLDAGGAGRPGSLLCGGFKGFRAGICLHQFSAAAAPAAPATAAAAAGLASSRRARDFSPGRCG